MARKKEPFDYMVATQAYTMGVLKQVFHEDDIFCNITGSKSYKSTIVVSFKRPRRLCILYFYRAQEKQYQFDFAILGEAEDAAEIEEYYEINEEVFTMEKFIELFNILIPKFL